ncbi:MAG: hypothetical protein M3N54_04390 [Acidobacteriota bacterium]|nr:hypothetical protein [Acidobacteriota bacterium]
MKRSNKKWPVIIGAVFIVGVIATIMMTSRGNAAYRCEVCVTFEGRTVCRNGAAPTREGAERTASDIACTDLSSGMTSLMQCQSAAPRKVTWK